jgi:hypothetical protein
MPLTIPKEYARGLAALTALDDEEFSAFARALAEVPATSRQRKEVTAFIQTKLGEGRPRNVDALMRALLSLYQARAFAETPPIEEFVEDLAIAVKDSGLPELDLDEEGRNRFVRNMRALLSVDTLVFLAKANALQRDHEKIFHSAKILTDLRPVFHGVDQQPKDMILEYTLKLVFHDGSRRHREIYMVLDSRDMVALRDAIDRAEQKAASLKSLCESNDIAVIPSLTEV